MVTKTELDEAQMELGRDYANLPESKFRNFPKYPTFRGGGLLGRSKTMIELKKSDTNQSASIKYKTNKLGNEKLRIDEENKERIQKMEMSNRQKELDLIGPKEDIRLLRYKHESLEKRRDQNAAPFLKQNIAQHVKTFYDQEKKFLGERAELYRSASVYDPNLLKQHVELTKEGAPMNRFYADASPYISSHLDGRSVRFADQVMDEHLNGKRAPLETILLDPNSNADPRVQENGFIQEQSTYGSAYNTKKFLQENSLVSREPLAYERLSKTQIDAQNEVLKDTTENTTTTTTITYPRTYGPLPPEPYEPIYSNYDASEMSDGYAKRDHHRVYSSPFVKFPPRYEQLASDVEAIREFEEEQARGNQEREAIVREALEARMEQARTNVINHTRTDFVARRVNDKAYELMNEVRAPPRSTYAASYEPYRFETTVKCPPNQFARDVEYSGSMRVKSANFGGQTKPVDLNELQDSWTKTDAHRRFHSAFNSTSVDLRLPGGKKKVKNIPA